MTFLSTYCTTFWHGVLLSTCLWLCVLNLSLWYWRRKIRELGALFKKLSETVAAPTTHGEG